MSPDADPRVSQGEVPATAEPPGPDVTVSELSRADLGTHAIGLVIGTYAALPYIHLQLEARKRLYLNVPTLVHDDGSRQGAELEALSKEYGAEFTTHPVRHRQHLGDLSVYAVGLEWAKRRRLRFLHKVSRRWIWRVDWRESLLRLFEDSEAPTLSNFTEAFDFGFRTECIAFDIDRWSCEVFMEDVQERIDSRAEVFVESYMHKWAGTFADTASSRWHAWNALRALPPHRQGYAPWPLMGTCRRTRNPNYLWHDCNPAEDYAALAADWGLPYGVEDFHDPNVGAGSGSPR